MKTLCFTLGLLLFVVCCSDAMPAGVVLSTGPSQCCFEFGKNPVPAKKVTGISRTHRACQHKAFIVSTVKGKQICYREDFPWAKTIFDELNIDGSS